MIPIAKPLIGEEEIRAVEEVLRTGMLAHGRVVEEFERAFADYTGVKHGVAVANGTLALDVALKSIGIKSGEEVITTPFTFIASANSILYQGARAVFADIDDKTFTLDPEDVKEKITPRTRAILVVHLFGHPADMRPIMEIAEDHGIYVVEDCAQSHGATYRGVKTGSIGHVAAFSFYPTKNMTTGEGGMVLTSDDAIAKKARLIRNHGQSEKYLHVALGYNYRMTNIAAAIGLCQLRKLDEWNSIRERNARALTNGLSRVRGLITPHVAPYAKHVWHQYVVRVTEDFSMSRDELRDALRERGVGTAVHYPMPVHHQPLYRELGYRMEDCPVACRVAKEVLSLPVHPAVSEDDVKYIVNAVKGFAL